MGPLSGQRIVITRPRHQASKLVQRLEGLGAEVISAPAISIRPPDDPAPLREAIARIREFQWVVFTSANGVDAVLPHLPAFPEGTKVAAVGPGTRAVLEARGIPVALMPGSYRVQALAEALTAQGDLRGVRFLLPRADRANPVLPEVLRRAGADVREVVAYRTVHEGIDDETRSIIASGEVDAVTFTSASTVEGFLAQVTPELLLQGGERPRIVTIGPESSRAVRRAGLEVTSEADPHTIDGLVSAVLSG
jgi:uroporphyrinogen III methyltransferase/synthase